MKKGYRREVLSGLSWLYFSGLKSSGGLGAAVVLTLGAAEK
jgi:hypothetical protein